MAQFGFTTGSCAAAAAKAAAYMLLTGHEKKKITIQTPKGILYHAQILNIIRQEQQVQCAVRKDGGDDPDITTGAFVTAVVSLAGESVPDGGQILIDGGTGVGRVTKPGLDQPVGNAAINHVPREMIEKEVKDVCTLTDYRGRLRVVISVPGGEELARKTFNPRLGIEGGISILGTSGIVEPMSSQALLDTILVELRQRKAMGHKYVAVSPGNYGLDFMLKAYQYELDQSVKCSNFIGDTIDMAVELSYEGLLLTGHIGKLIKVSGGIMNTHSREGDCRMELLAAAGLRAGVKDSDCRKLLDCVTTQEALQQLSGINMVEPVMKEVMEKITFYLDRRASGKLNIQSIVYDNEIGELGRSEGALSLLQQIKEES